MTSFDPDDQSPFFKNKGRNLRVGLTKYIFKKNMFRASIHDVEMDNWPPINSLGRNNLYRKMCFFPLFFSFHDSNKTFSHCQGLFNAGWKWCFQQQPALWGTISLNWPWHTRVLTKILSYWEYCCFVPMLHIHIGCLQLYLPPLPLTSMLRIFNLSLSPSCCLCKTLASSLSRETQHAKFAGSRIKVRKPKRSTDRDNKGEGKESRNLWSLIILIVFSTFSTM